MILLVQNQWHFCRSFSRCKESIFLSSQLNHFLHSCIYRPSNSHCVDSSLCLISYKFAYYHTKERAEKYKRHCDANNFIIYSISFKIFRVFLLKIDDEPKDSCNNCNKRRYWHSLIHLEAEEYEHHRNITSGSRNSSCIRNCNHYEHNDQTACFQGWVLEKFYTFIDS